MLFLGHLVFQFDSTILRPPNMDPKKREELLSEMRDLIDTFLVETLEEQARGIICGGGSGSK